MRFHTLALPLLGLFAYSVEDGDLERAGRRFGGFVAMLLAVLVHELSHGVVARRRGLRVFDVRVHAVGGAARIERPPAVVWTPRDEWVPALAGPLGNLLTAVVTWLLVLAAGYALPPLGLGSPAWGRDPVAAFLSANVVLGVVNLVPAFPSDGGRILRALLAARWPYRTATYVAVAVGGVAILGTATLLLEASGPRALVPLGLPSSCWRCTGSPSSGRSGRASCRRGSTRVRRDPRRGPADLATLPKDARGLPLPDPAILGRPDAGLPALPREARAPAEGPSRGRTRIGRAGRSDVGILEARPSRWMPCRSRGPR